MNQEPLVEDIQNYALNIVDTVREPLLILDATLRVKSANRAFYQTFQVSAEETVDRLSFTSWATASGTFPTCGDCSKPSWANRGQRSHFYARARSQRTICTGFRAFGPSYQEID